MRQILRERSRTSHQQLDDFVLRLKPFTTTGGYRIYLTAMYRLYARFGDPLDQVSEWAGVPKSKSTLQQCIAADLGYKPEVTETSVEIWRTEDSWAAAYMMEGSAMGAKQMLKQLKPNCMQGMGCSFLSRLAGDTRIRWPVIVAALDAADCNEAETVNAVQSHFDIALQTFVDAAIQLREHEEHRR